MGNLPQAASRRLFYSTLPGMKCEIRMRQINHAGGNMQRSDGFAWEILNLEKKYWQAMSDHDLQTALSLTDFPCLVAGGHGLQLVDKEQFTKMFDANQETPRKFKFDDEKTQVRQVGADTAIIAYNVRTTFSKDGEERTVDAIDTSTWVKRFNRWVCAMHTETELSKPH
jgi:uncharacterized protein (TIGR02246 family)